MVMEAIVFFLKSTKGECICLTGNIVSMCLIECSVMYIMSMLLCGCPFLADRISLKGFCLFECLKVNWLLAIILYHCYVDAWHGP